MNKEKIIKGQTGINESSKDYFSDDFMYKTFKSELMFHLTFEINKDDNFLEGEVIQYPMEVEKSSDEYNYILLKYSMKCNYYESNFDN